MTRFPWRVGRKVVRTIYRQIGPEPSDDDELIGVMDTPELAHEVVTTRNAFWPMPRQGPIEIPLAEPVETPRVCSKCGTAGCLEDAESGWYDEPEAEQPLADWEQELLTENDRRVLAELDTLTDIVYVALGERRSGTPRDVARAVQAAGFRR